MAAFALKTVFAAAAFFAAVAGHDQCGKRVAALPSGAAVLQLFTHDDCVTESLLDHQTIMQLPGGLKDKCACAEVDAAIGHKISSILFEKGFQPEAVFYLLQGMDCAGDEIGYGPYPAHGMGGLATAMLHMDQVLGYARIMSVEICSSPEIRKKKLREVKAKEAAEAVAKGYGSIWDKFGDDL
ncbi:hypothetical protein BJ138DRAFT_1166180, partial [Hygrophoropsis aurantiaca]